MAMKIQPLTQADKDTIVTMARSLAGRALNAGDAQATTHAAAHSAAQARDKIAEFDQRLEMMNREVNTRLSASSPASAAAPSISAPRTPPGAG